MISRMITKGFLGKNPAHLILQVTDACSLSCRTCFQRRAGRHDLDLSRIRHVASRLGRDLLWVEVTGGEPFLRDDLPEICALFGADLLPLSTNGQAPETVARMVREVRAGIRGRTELSVSVSMDGFRETHDDLRGRGAFDAARTTLRLLQEIPGIKTKVNTVLCNRNGEELLRFMQTVRRWDPDFHSVILLRGAPRDGELRLPPVADLRAMQEGIFRVWASYDYGVRGRLRSRVLKNYQRLAFETSLEVLETKTQRPRCLAGSRHLVVLANGDVAFCELGAPVGNLLREDLDGILHSEAAGRQRAFIASGGCFCHHNCNMMDNVFLSPLQAARLLLGSRR